MVVEASVLYQRCVAKMSPDHHHNATASPDSIVIQSWLCRYSVMGTTEYRQVRRMHRVQVLNRRIPTLGFVKEGIHPWLGEVTCLCIYTV